jgi:Ran GTPase-activating protein (RanGAP) involved in mRNA processing and transport
MSSFAEMLRKVRQSNPSFTHLDAEFTERAPFGDEGCITIADALKVNKVVLSVNMANQKINEKGAEHIDERLRDVKVITNLDLSRNFLQDEGAAHIANFLLGENVVAGLNLDEIYITSKGAYDLAKALKNNKALTSLNLGNNPKMGEHGAKELGEALKVNKHIRVLCLNNTGMLEAGLVTLAHALADNKTIRALYLDSNELGGDAELKPAQNGLHQFVDMAKANHSLEIVSLRENRINDKSAVLIGQMLRDNQSLTCLSLYNNNIGEYGGKQISTALRECPKLERLDLDGNPIGPSACIAIANTLADSRLIYLELCDVGANDLTCKAFADALPGQKTLKELKLSNNEKITNSGCETLYWALLDNRCCQHIEVLCTSVGAARNPGWPWTIAALETLCQQPAEDKFREKFKAEAEALLGERNAAAVPVQCGIRVHQARQATQRRIAYLQIVARHAVYVQANVRRICARTLLKRMRAADEARKEREQLARDKEARKLAREELAKKKKEEAAEAERLRREAEALALQRMRDHSAVTLQRRARGMFGRKRAAALGGGLSGKVYRVYVSEDGHEENPPGAEGDGYLEMVANGHADVTAEEAAAAESESHDPYAMHVWKGGGTGWYREKKTGDMAWILNEPHAPRKQTSKKVPEALFRKLAKEACACKFPWGIPLPIMGSPNMFLVPQRAELVHIGTLRMAEMQDQYRAVLAGGLSVEEYRRGARVWLRMQMRASFSEEAFGAFRDRHTRGQMTPLLLRVCQMMDDGTVVERWRTEVSNAEYCVGGPAEAQELEIEWETADLLAELVGLGGKKKKKKKKKSRKDEDMLLCLSLDMDTADPTAPPVDPATGAMRPPTIQMARTLLTTRQLLDRMQDGDAEDEGGDGDEAPQQRAFPLLATTAVHPEDQRDALEANGGVAAKDESLAFGSFGAGVVGAFGPPMAGYNTAFEQVGEIHILSAQLSAFEPSDEGFDLFSGETEAESYRAYSEAKVGWQRDGKLTAFNEHAGKQCADALATVLGGLSMGQFQGGLGGGIDFPNPPWLRLQFRAEISGLRGRRPETVLVVQRQHLAGEGGAAGGASGAEESSSWARQWQNVTLCTEVQRNAFNPVWKCRETVEAALCDHNAGDVLVVSVYSVNQVQPWLAAAVSAPDGAAVDGGNGVVDGVAPPFSMLLLGQLRTSLMDLSGKDAIGQPMVMETVEEETDDPKQKAPRVTLFVDRCERVGAPLAPEGLHADQLLEGPHEAYRRYIEHVRAFLCSCSNMPAGGATAVATDRSTRALKAVLATHGHGEHQHHRPALSLELFKSSYLGWWGRAAQVPDKRYAQKLSDLVRAQAVPKDGHVVMPPEAWQVSARQNMLRLRFQLGAPALVVPGCSVSVSVCTSVPATAAQGGKWAKDQLEVVSLWHSEVAGCAQPMWSRAELDGAAVLKILEAEAIRDTKAKFAAVAAAKATGEAGRAAQEASDKAELDKLEAQMAGAGGAATAAEVPDAAPDAAAAAAAAALAAEAELADILAMDDDPAAKALELEPEPESAPPLALDENGMPKLAGPALVPPPCVLIEVWAHQQPESQQTQPGSQPPSRPGTAATPTLSAADAAADPARQRIGYCQASLQALATAHTVRGPPQLRLVRFEDGAGEFPPRDSEGAASIVDAEQPATPRAALQLCGLEINEFDLVDCRRGTLWEEWLAEVMHGTGFEEALAAKQAFEEQKKEEVVKEAEAEAQ